MFLSYSVYGCLQSKNHQNLWKWLAISPITTFGGLNVKNNAGVADFISDVRIVINTPTLSLCSSSIEEARTKVDATP